MPHFALRRPRGFVALASIAALTAAFVGAQAPDLESTPIDQVTARFVVKLLEDLHISQPEISDEVAVRWAENYIESLDRLKYTFLQADVDEFMAQADQLDDRIKEGDISFSTLVFKRYLARLDERTEAALELLKEKPDFTIDESIVDDPKLIAYPATADEASQRLRKLIKLDILRRTVSNPDTTAEKIAEEIAIQYQDLNRYYHNFNSSDILEVYLTAMTMAVDPQTNYLKGETVEDFLQQQLHLSLEGIGASLQIQDGLPKVMEIVPGGAADADGRLMPGDKIVGILLEGDQKEDFYGKKLSDIVRKIRGPAGSKVNLLVTPADSKEIKTYELTRQKIELKEQHAAGKVIETKGPDGQALKVGVIDLPSFYGDRLAVLQGDPNAVSVTLDVKKILEDFKKQGVDVVLIDLRMNGGGLLMEAVSLSGLFIDTGPVVQVRGFDGIRHHSDEEEGTSWDGPLAVLIDRFSASASEIFAGVIRDYDRGLIIGDSSTYGKGTVQQIVSLNEIPQIARLGDKAPNLGAVKLTIQQFYRANGDSTQIRGVEPHIHIPSILDYQDVGEGTNKNPLKFDQIAPLPHDSYGRVPKDLVASLNERSDSRRQEDPEFQKQAAALERYLERKARHEISLNETKYRAETAAQEIDAEEAKVAPADEPKRKRSEREIWKPGAYNDEVVRIITDYVALGGDILTAGPIPAGDARRPLRP